MAAPSLTSAQVGQCPQNTQAIPLPSKWKWLVVLGLAAHNVPFPNQRRSGASLATHSVERTSRAACHPWQDHYVYGTEHCSTEHSRLALTLSLSVPCSESRPLSVGWRKPTGHSPWFQPARLKVAADR